MNSRSVLVCIFLFGFAHRLPAHSNLTFVQFRPGAVKGALYKPDSGRAPHVAVLVIRAAARPAPLARPSRASIRTR